MSRRSSLRILACGIAALAVLVVPVLADELIGRITAVNIDAKKLTVKEKGTDKDVDVTVTDETIVEKASGKSGKINLEKMQKNVEKAKGGIPVEITHDKGVASKILYKAMPKKTTEAPKKEDTKKDERN
jgi:hypothetical protein